MRPRLDPPPLPPARVSVTSYLEKRRHVCRKPLQAMGAIVSLCQLRVGSRKVHHDCQSGQRSTCCPPASRVRSAHRLIGLNFRQSATRLLSRACVRNSSPARRSELVSRRLARRALPLRHPPPMLVERRTWAVWNGRRGKSWRSRRPERRESPPTMTWRQRRRRSELARRLLYIHMHCFYFLLIKRCFPLARLPQPSIVLSGRRRWMRR